MKLPFQLSKLDYWVYGLSLALCFLLFKQSDLTHTNSSSFAYLYGHFWDFYDYNSTRMGDNNYLPIFYIFFAIWNIPLKILGLIPEVTSETWMQATAIQTIWSKLLLVIFFFAVVSLVGKITSQICAGLTKEQSLQNKDLPRLLFATSPIAIFAVFIFGGYDIFALFFMLLGMRAYFAKDFKWFVVWFSVAISFKYFAAFVYLPLVLIIEKRFIRLVVYGLLGLLAAAIQFALYWHSDVFLGEIFSLVGAKTAVATEVEIKIRPLLINGLYGLMCCYLYFSKFDFKSHLLQWSRRAIFACMLSYALLFSWVLWHPQWILLITPFICLSFLFIRSKRLFLAIEIMGYLGFAAFTMNNWVGNVDNTMLYGGVFGNLLPQTSTFVTDIIGRKSMALSRTFFYLSLYAPFLIFLVETFVIKKFASDDFFNHEIKRDANQQTAQIGLLFRMRFLVGCYFVISLTLACFLPIWG